MFKRLLTFTVVLTYTICLSGIVKSSADDLFFNRPAGSDPSIFYYGWRGLFIGSLAGLSAGYVRYADSNNTSGMLSSLAYGALFGAGVGLIAGFADAANNNAYGTGDILLHDMNRGGIFGLGVGALWGGINAITKGDSKEVGKGAAWGYLGGLVIGVGVAVVENANPSVIASPSSSLPSFSHSIAFHQDSKSNLYPGLELAWRY
jgi:hypothetical protein